VAVSEQTTERETGAGPIDHYEQFVTYQRTGDRSVRNELVERYAPLVEFTVRRFRPHGTEHDDLRQVAFLAMLLAVDRFDPDRGIQFSTFASQSMEGELKRHLRDRSWSVRPPRRSQELHLELRDAEERLTQALGRAPTIGELATELNRNEDDVLLALEARQAYRASSLDAAPVLMQRRRTTNAGDSDGFDQIDMADTVNRLLARLPEKERQLLTMRFIEGMSQPAMAAQLGVSQSYLSRMLRRTISKVKARDPSSSASYA
jgi:RNA polymerase sigma-B factor